MSLLSLAANDGAILRLYFNGVEYINKVSENFKYYDLNNNIVFNRSADFIIPNGIIFKLREAFNNITINEFLKMISDTKLEICFNFHTINRKKIQYHLIDLIDLSDQLNAIIKHKDSMIIKFNKISKYIDNILLLSNTQIVSNIVFSDDLHNIINKTDSSLGVKYTFYNREYLHNIFI